MTRQRIVAFSGSTRRPSRSRALAEAVAESARRHSDFHVTFYDILDAGSGLGAAYTRNELPAEALRVVEAIEQADALIATGPTYKGTYPGLFKHLIDFVDQAALYQKPVVVGATGAGFRHALALEHQWRPLFGFFSARLVSTSLFAADQEFADGAPHDADLLKRIDAAGLELAQLLNWPRP